MPVPTLPGCLYRRYNKFVDGEDYLVLVIATGAGDGVIVIARGEVALSTVDALSRRGTVVAWRPDATFSNVEMTLREPSHLSR